MAVRIIPNYGAIAGTLLFFIGLGIFTAYHKVSDWLEYDEVGATITGATITCFRTAQHPQYPGTIMRGPCGDLADLSTRELLDRHVIRDRIVRFSYVSPVDGRSHDGTYVASVADKFDLPEDRIFTGKTGHVLASTSEAAAYKTIPFGFRSPS